MAVKKTKRGSGITKRRVTVFEKPHTAQEQETIDVITSGDFEKLYGLDIENLALKVLAQANIDYVNGEPKIKGKKAKRGRDYSEDGEVDFSLRMLRLLGVIRKGIEAGNAPFAARFGMDLGMLLKEASYKSNWEHHALRGARIHESAKEGGRARKGINAERDLDLAKQYRERRKDSNLSDSALKAKIGEKVGLKRSAAIEAVDKGLKILSG